MKGDGRGIGPRVLQLISTQDSLEISFKSGCSHGGGSIDNGPGTITLAKPAPEATDKAVLPPGSIRVGRLQCDSPHRNLLRTLRGQFVGTRIMAGRVIPMDIFCSHSGHLRNLTSVLSVILSPPE